MFVNASYHLKSVTALMMEVEQVILSPRTLSDQSKDSYD